MKRKWKVLIVDDEFRIAMLIKKLIKWDELGLECLNIVDNGESALRIIEEQAPDILLTDIRMPKINGLDLAKICWEENKPINIVVISGYKEFEYARSALRYGVENYLLKPINEQELNNVLKDITQKLDAKMSEEEERINLTRKVKESEQIVRRDFFKEIIEMEDEEPIADERIQLTGELYCGIDIKLDYTNLDHEDKQRDKKTVERITGIIDHRMKAVVEELLICEKEDLHIFCLVNYRQENKKDIKNCISAVLTEMKEYLLGFEHYEVTVGVGAEKQEFAEIRHSINESKRAIQNRIKLGTGRLIYWENLEVTEEQFYADAYKKCEETLRMSVESYSREKLEYAINQAYSAFMNVEKMDAINYYLLADKIVNSFMLMLNVPSEDKKVTKKEIVHKCQHCYTVMMLKNTLKQELGTCIDSVKDALEAEAAKPVRQAMNYVEEHYSEKIVLEDLAALVDLNPVYFSVLFKKETDMNFSAYLLNVRMEKAKKLLCETNETIAAIGERVGYKDSRYFSQTFAKAVGIKPVLYRKLHS